MLFQQLFLLFHLKFGECSAVFWKDGIVPYLVDEQFDQLMAKKIERAILSRLKFTKECSLKS
jgi:hypothetical protein